MNILGHWIPLAFANTLFSFWMVEVALLGAWVWWLTKRDSPGKPARGANGVRRRVKRARRRS